MTAQSNRIPIKQRPTLKLKLGPSSSAPPADPVPAQRPTPPPRPASAAEPIAASAVAARNLEVKPPRKINAERAAAIEEERVASEARKAAETARLALREAIQQRAIKTMEALMDRFPLCFKKPVPMKVGIRKDIYDAAPDLDRHDVVNALDGYCNSEAYKAVLVEGAVRVGLDGEPAGVVTTGQASWAKTRFPKQNNQADKGEAL